MRKLFIVKRLQLLRKRCLNSLVAKWLENQTGLWKVVGSTSVEKNYDKFSQMTYCLTDIFLMESCQVSHPTCIFL